MVVIVWHVKHNEHRNNAGTEHELTDSTQHAASSVSQAEPLRARYNVFVRRVHGPKGATSSTFFKLVQGKNNISCKTLK
jgi:hypothetical protein